MPAAPQGGVPDDNDRALLESLPENGMLELERPRWGFKEAGLSLRRHDGGWIDDDGFHILIEIVGQPQQKQAGLGGDGDPDLVGQLQPARALPVLFGDKDLDQSAQVIALGLFQHAEMGDILADDGFPFGRERLLGELLAAMIALGIKTYIRPEFEDMAGKRLCHPPH
jgi:hypothetical protein